jgi:deazaflavin-dependent oxidoreductase (nitroreductase family)
MQFRTQPVVDQPSVEVPPDPGRDRHRTPDPLRWFFRLPVLLYRLGLADQLGKSTLLLTTHGRKSGRRYTTPLNYVVEGDITYVLAGNGPSSDWLLNLRADPRVEVQVGACRFSACAGTLDDAIEHRRVLGLWAEQSLRMAPPPAAQALMRWLGFDYEASTRRHLSENPPPPIVVLRRIG